MPRILHFAFFLALLCALGIRLYDLTDPPFDFHPTRQFRSAIMARGMYYETRTDVPDAERASMVRLWKKEVIIEPPVLERLVALTYRLVGEEHIWIARVYSSSFWVSAGLAVFLIGREWGSVGGGVLAALYFLFLQYGIIASRTFQPDPLMVALMAWGLWAFVRWHRVSSVPNGERGAFGWAILAGVLIGLAVYIKTVAGILLAGAVIGVVIQRFNDSAIQRKSPFHDPQLWVLGGLAVLPAALYYIYGLYVEDFLRQQLNFRFFPEMWMNPAFYVQWTNIATGIAGFMLIAAGLVGALMWRDRGMRGMGIGLWVGYVLYSITFPYHTTTHDYYQLPLILIVALGLIPIAESLLEQIARPDNRRLIQTVFTGVVIYAVLFQIWGARTILARQDDRDAPFLYGRFADIVPPNHTILAITQAYGFPLAYYGSVNVELWPYVSDSTMRELAGINANELEQRRARKLQGRDLFLVTDFEEFNRQADWKEYLFTHFAVFKEGEGYIIFDLHQPLEPEP